MCGKRSGHSNAKYCRKGDSTSAQARSLSVSGGGSQTVLVTWNHTWNSIAATIRTPEDFPVTGWAERLGKKGSSHVNAVFCFPCWLFQSPGTGLNTDAIVFADYVESRLCVCVGPKQCHIIITSGRTSFFSISKCFPSQVSQQNHPVNSNSLCVPC